MEKRSTHACDTSEYLVSTIIDMEGLPHKAWKEAQKGSQRFETKISATLTVAPTALAVEVLLSACSHCRC